MPFPKNFITPFIVNRELAIRRHDLEPNIANRVALTGLFVGGESSTMSMLYTEVLAQREEPAAPAATAPAPPAEKRLIVPLVVDKERSVAKEILIREKFTVFEREEESEGEPGTVFKVVPPEGARVLEGTTATLFIRTRPIRPKPTGQTGGKNPP